MTGLLLARFLISADFLHVHVQGSRVIWNIGCARMLVIS